MKTLSTRIFTRSLLAVLCAAALVGWQHAWRRIPQRPALGIQIERAGRPLTGNALIFPLGPADSSNNRKEAYNRAAPADWAQFVPYLQRSLGLYDGFDGVRGNAWLADRGTAPAVRYQALARLLADDRLWVNSASTTCTQLFAVELAALGSRGDANADCGGRTPSYDAVDTWRAMLTNGTASGVEDGVDRDDHVHSATTFPFLSSP